MKYVGYAVFIGAFLVQNYSKAADVLRNAQGVYEFGYANKLITTVSAHHTLDIDTLFVHGETLE